MKRKTRELQVNLPLRKEMWRFTIFNSFKAKLPARRLHHQEKKKKRKENLLCIGSKFDFVQVYYFPFTREWWGLWKWVLPKKKTYRVVILKYWSNSLVLWRAALSEPLLVRGSSLLTSGFPRIVYKLIVPWPGSALGKKWDKMEWNGTKRSRGPFSLVPRLPLNSLCSPLFFFSFEFSPNYGALSQAKVIAVQDFLFSKWFCTDIILYFKNRSPPSPPHPDS